MNFRAAVRIIAQSSLLAVVASSGLHAQTTASNPPGAAAAAAPQNRFSFGVRIGAPMYREVAGVSSVDSTSATDPPTTTTTEIDGKGLRFVVGPTLEYRVADKLSIGADLLYRRAGYDSAVTVVSQTTSAIPFQEYQETRLNYFDAPLLLRYFPGGAKSSGVQPYLLGGAALRFATGLSTVTDTIDADGLVDTNRSKIDLANSSVFGGMLGGGLRLVDDVGFKVDIETRYTRWGRQVIQFGGITSNQNQIEFMFGLTF